MAKLADIVKNATTEISTAVKEIRQSDDDDLTTISEAFDRVAQIADKAATRIANADQALSQDDDTDAEDAGQGEPDNGQPDNETT